MVQGFGGAVIAFKISKDAGERYMQSSTEPISEESTRPLKCIVITPVGPGHERLAEEARASVQAACETSLGPFSEISFVPLLDTEGKFGRSRRRNDGIRYAMANGFDWIFFLDADDLLLRDAFASVAPYVNTQDAVFGMIAELEAGSTEIKLREKQLGQSTSIADILRVDPMRSIQMGHFVRATVASAIGFDVALDTGEDFKYYLELWRQYRAIKIDKPLFINRIGIHAKGTKSANGWEWRAATNKVFEEFCARYPTTISFPWEGKVAQFVLGNPRDMIHQYLLAGRFFEADELAFLKEAVGPQATILEVGANIGNHLVYYGLYMNPKKIIPIEPNPAAIALLKKNSELNQLTMVDTSLLGFGIGDKHGHFQMQIADQANIGAARLLAAEEGTVEVFPLDARYDGDVDFMKIDVEWMEMEALSGAANLIKKNRPKIYIEIMNDNIPAFEAWVEENHYSVAKIFACVNARNYFVVPMPVAMSDSTAGLDVGSATKKALNQ